MTATRHALLERAAQALTHALDTCAGDDTRATLSKAFSKHKLQTIFDLASFPEDILAKLDYDDEDLIDRSCIPLDLSCHHVIRQLRVYHREHRNKDNTLDIEFWFNVTVESWLEWTMNQANNIPSTITVPVPAPPAPVPVPTDASTVDSSVATEFPPGYKLNMSRYSECILKDPSKLLLWEETFLDKTNGDYLDTIFTKEDTKYKPKSKRRRKRHAQKQRIGFEILSTVIQFAAGKNILRKYRSSNDAQQAYIDIRKEAGGITNELDKASLMDEITSMKIKDSTPDNKVEKIIEDVNTKIQAYDDRQIATAGCKPMEDSFKVGLLNAVIFNHHKLLTAKQSVLSDCARDQKVATYADFYNRYKTEAKIMAHTSTTTNREANQRLEINEGNQEDVQEDATVATVFVVKGVVAVTTKKLAEVGAVEAKETIVHRRPFRHTLQILLATPLSSSATTLRIVAA
jgi:hypothetical protein